MPLPSYPYPHSAPTLDVPAPQIGQLGLQLQQLNQQAPLVQAQTEHLGAQTQQLEQVRQDRQAIAQKFGMPVEAVDAALKTLEHIHDDATKVQFINRVFPGLNLKYDPASKRVQHVMSTGVLRDFNVDDGTFRDIGTPMASKPENLSADEKGFQEAQKLDQTLTWAEYSGQLAKGKRTEGLTEQTDADVLAAWAADHKMDVTKLTAGQRKMARDEHAKSLKEGDPELLQLRKDVMQKNIDRPAPQQTVIIQTRDAAGNPVTQVVSKEDALKKTKNEGGYARPEAAMTENRKVAARNSLSMGNELIGLLDDPEIQAKLGPFMGRAASLQQWAGNLPPDLAELAGTIMSWTELQPAVHGMRSSEMAENIEKNLPLKMTPAALKGFVRGFNRTAKTVATSGSAKDTVGTETVTPAAGGGTAIDALKAKHKIEY